MLSTVQIFWRSESSSLSRYVALRLAGCAPCPWHGHGGREAKQARLELGNFNLIHSGAPLVIFSCCVGLVDPGTRFEYTKPQATARLQGTVALNYCAPLIWGTWCTPSAQEAGMGMSCTLSGGTLALSDCSWGCRDYLGISVSLIILWSCMCGPSCRIRMLSWFAFNRTGKTTKSGFSNRTCRVFGLVGTCSDSQISQNHMQRLRSCGKTRNVIPSSNCWTCLIMFSMFTGNAARNRCN